MEVTVRFSLAQKAWEMLGLQAVLAGIIFVTGLSATLSPRCVSKLHPAAVGLGSMVASGVLFAAALVHQLDSANEALASLQDETGFPWASFICGCAFSVFLLLEEGVHVLVPADDARAARRVAHEYATAAANEDFAAVGRSAQDHSHDHNHENDHDHASHVTRFAAQDETVGSLGAAIALLLALTVHSVLAGYAIGFASGEKAAIAVAVAILAHKFFAGFALGSTLRSARVALCRHVVLALIFSLATPFGIVVGAVVKIAGSGATSTQRDRALGVVDAVVAGTFLYIAIVEIGANELRLSRHCSVECGPSARKEARIVHAAKLLCFLVGYAGMSYLALYV